MTFFSDHATAKLLQLYNHHDGQVGSKLKESNPEAYRNYEATNCITYVKQVLLHAYRASGRDEFAQRLERHIAKVDQAGTKVASFLVSEDNWTGVFTNPDTTYPDDEAAEATRKLRRTCKYYNVPISFKLVDYAPGMNTKLEANEPLASIQYNRMVSVKFGFGCSAGGYHTWLYSYGYVYEVHYLEPPGPGLYERTMLSTFTTRRGDLRSGALFIPPDAFTQSLLKEATDMQCRALNHHI